MKSLIFDAMDRIWVGKKYEWLKTFGPFFAAREEFGLHLGIRVGNDCSIALFFGHN